MLPLSVHWSAFKPLPIPFFQCNAFNCVIRLSVLWVVMSTVFKVRIRIWTIVGIRAVLGSKLGGLLSPVSFFPLLSLLVCCCCCCAQRLVCFTFRPRQRSVWLDLIPNHCQTQNAFCEQLHSVSVLVKQSFAFLSKEIAWGLENGGLSSGTGSHYSLDAGHTFFRRSCLSQCGS